MTSHSTDPQIESTLSEDKLKSPENKALGAMEKLAAGVAHDFNNLLAVISGYCDYLLTRLPKDSPFLEDIHEIKHASDRGARLTAKLLAFSRKQFLEPRLIHLNDLILNLKPKINKIINPGVTLETHLDNSLLKVNVDPARFEQVLIDLVTNADDVMPEGGKLVIATANETHTCTLRLRHTQRHTMERHTH